MSLIEMRWSFNSVIENILSCRNRAPWHTHVVGRTIASGCAIVMAVAQLFFWVPSASAGDPGRPEGGTLQFYTGNKLIWGDVPGVLQIRKAGTESLITLDGRTAAASGFTATALPDGPMLLSGGFDASGRGISALDEVSPSGTIRHLKAALSEPRVFHTATLLTDARVVFIGGAGQNGAALSSIEYFDTVTGQVSVSGSSLIAARSNHQARLLATGMVLIHGGTDAAGAPALQDELLDPVTGSVIAYSDALRQQYEVRPDAGVPVVAEILPPHEARSVDVEEFVAVRFSRAPEKASVSSESVTLFGPTGMVTGTVVPAQEGMLAFFIPSQDLLPDSRYTVFVQGLVDQMGNRFPFAASSFNTAKVSVPAIAPLADPVIESPRLSDDLRFVHPLANLRWPLPPSVIDPEIWTPDRDALDMGNWKDKRAFVKRSVQRALIAADGVTALSGQVLKLDGEPLANVTLKIGDAIATTDRDGAFLLEGIPSGYSVLEIKGASANRDDAKYGRYLVRVHAAAGQTTELPFTIWMPKIDPRGTIKVSSPTTEEVVATTPAIPGLEVRIPAGTVIRDLDGKIVTEINITAIPVNRPPFPLPDFNIPVFFSVQPGGAWLQSVDVQAPKGAQIHYPNYMKILPGSRVSFWDYDPFSRDWFGYGEGAVAPDGKHVVPDAGVAIYQFTGAMFNSDPPAPGSGGGPDNNDSGPPLGNGPQGNGDGSNGPSPKDKGPEGNGHDKSGSSSGRPSCKDGGDPVCTSNGYFIRTETDLRLPDVEPLVLTRSYRSHDTGKRTFGIGWVSTYDTILYSQNQWQEVDVVLPHGERAHFARTSAGTSYTDAVFASTAPGAWYGAQIFRNNLRLGWDLIFRNGAKWFFPQFQPVKEIVDPNGNTTTITRRDSGGNSGPITRVESPNGRYIDFTLDSSGRVTQAKDNLGRIVSYTYDASGRLSKVTDPLLHEQNYTYDTSHRLLTVADPRGVTSITNVYDANGRVTSQTLADGNTFQYAYTVVNGKVTQTNVTDQRGKVRHVEFSPDGYITKSVAAYGTADAQQTLFGLDTNGQMTSITDSLGRLTALTYDGFGNRSSVTRLQGTPNAVTTSFTYTADGAHLQSVTEPLGRTATFSYDARGNLLSSTDPLGHTVTFTRDAQGRVVTRTDALNHTWTYAYSGPDLASITDPLSRTTQFFTDAIGRTTAIQNPSGETWSYEFDLRRRVTKVTDSLAGVVRFNYDANGNLASHVDQNNNTTTYGYNSLSARSGKTDPLGHAETYTYGANGLVSQIVDRKGQLTGITFDNLNRVGQVGYGASVAAPTAYLSTIGYTYDAGDRKTQIVDSAGGTITRTYDGLDRLTQEQTPEGSVSYTYDASGRRTSMTVAGQAPTSYSWDNADRLTQITQGTDTVTFAYDNADRRTSTTLANGVVMAYGYDSANQLTSITYTKGSTTLGDLTYAYDLAGRRTSIGGSLAAVNLPAAIAPGMVNANNQLTSWAGGSLAYDLNGNLTGDGTNTYVWNERNQLAGISGGASASFVYDALGRRRSKTINGTQTGFLYDGMNFVQELAGGTAAANLVAGGIDELLGRRDASGSTYAITDALGSVIGLTDAAGVLQTQYSYEPYGKTTVTGAASGNSQMYTGRENDGTGLFFYRARYYHPGIGRFVSEDPLGPVGGLNLYTYVRGNPINFRDPAGLNPLAGAGAGAGLGGLTGGSGLGGMSGSRAGSNSNIANQLSNLIFNNGRGDPPVRPPMLPAGWDGLTPPAPGWEWRGKDPPGGDRGAWVSPDGSQSLHPDFDHGGDVGGHVDWNDPDGGRWRIFPDGRCEPK